MLQSRFLYVACNVFTTCPICCLQRFHNVSYMLLTTFSQRFLYVACNVFTTFPICSIYVSYMFTTTFSQRCLQRLPQRLRLHMGVNVTLYRNGSATLCWFHALR